jgi:hypothetical protein
MKFSDRKLGFAVLMLVSLAFTSSRARSADDEWVRAAGRLVSKYHVVCAPGLPASQRQTGWFQLLEWAEFFGSKDGGREDSQSVRAAIACLAKWRAHEQLGDGASEQSREEYLSALQSLSPNDAKMVRRLFERALAGPNAPRPGDRVCRVTKDGEKVGLAATGYPLQGVFRKIADASGARIEVDPGVTGFCDWSDSQPIRLRNLLDRVAGAHDLVLVRLPEGAYRVRPTEEQRDLVLGEAALRSVSRAVAIKPTRSDEGITQGYFIAHGRYVPPPYRSEVVIKGNAISLYLNGLEIEKRYAYTTLKRVRQPRTPLPEGGQFGLHQSSDLVDYLSDQYGDLRKTLSHDRAMERLSEFVKTQHIVAGQVVADKEILMRLTDGRKIFVGFRGFSLKPKPPIPEDVARKRRKQVVAEVRRREGELAAVLKSDGLLLLSGKHMVRAFRGPGESRKILKQIVIAMEEIVRQKRALTRAAIGSGHNATEPGWDLLFNLDFREIERRLRKERLAENEGVAR